MVGGLVWHTGLFHTNDDISLVASDWVENKRDHIIMINLKSFLKLENYRLLVRRYIGPGGGETNCNNKIQLANGLSRQTVDLLVSHNVSVHCIKYLVFVVPQYWHISWFVTEPMPAAHFNTSQHDDVMTWKSYPLHWLVSGTADIQWITEGQ